MRVIPLDVSNKLHSRIQTLANKCNPVLDARICRPETPLVNEVYLERQTVLEGVNATDVSVAVTHPSFGYNYTNTKIFLAYISDGVLRVQTAAGKIRVQNHVWSDMGVEIPASACSIALNGTMPKNTKGGAEFITEPDPWLFWVYDSVLYGQKVNGCEPVVLAEANCTDVSAVRAMWSSSGGFDFGLVVFFLLSGQLYYRQLVDEEWMDAEVVSFGPDEVTWQEIAAFRTWDYRVGLQCKATNGTVYELFTQFMGIGKQTSEHIEVTTSNEGSLTGVTYLSAKSPAEHVELSTTATAIATYGLSSKPTRVYNADDGTGNYGTIVRVEMDYPVYNVEGNASSFTLRDSNSNIYTCVDAQSMDGGQIIQLTFLDFNLAEGTIMTLGYTAGSIQSPAAALADFLVSFAPTLLEAPDIPVPEPVQAWNTDVEGTEIALKFSQPLIGDVTGEELPVGYIKKKIDLSGVVVTTLNQYSPSYPGTRVIDGNISTYWRGTSISNWIQFAFPEAKTVVGLRIYLGSYYVSQFTFQGSNDGSTWTQIGGYYNAASSTTGQWYEISIDNSEEYSYYRINTTSGYSSSRVYVYEVEFQEYTPAGNELKMSVGGQAYNYAPGGTLQQVSRVVADVYPDSEDNTLLYLILNPGITNNLQSLVGDVTISYAGGTLRGLGGPAADFDFSFTPEGLESKNNPNSSEHINVASAIGVAQLLQVTYTNSSTPEHVELAVEAEGALIHIDDI